MTDASNEKKLTKAEERELQRLVERLKAAIAREWEGQLEQGRVLTEIKHKGLYKPAPNIEVFALMNFEVKQGQTYKFMNAARVYDELLPHFGNSVMPSRVSHTEALKTLTGDQLKERWQQVVDSGENVTAALIQRFGSKSAKAGGDSDEESEEKSDSTASWRILLVTHYPSESLHRWFGEPDEDEGEFTYSYVLRDASNMLSKFVSWFRANAEKYGLSRFELEAR